MSIIIVQQSWYCKPLYLWLGIESVTAEEMLQTISFDSGVGAWQRQRINVQTVTRWYQISLDVYRQDQRERRWNTGDTISGLWIPVWEHCIRGWWCQGNSLYGSHEGNVFSDRKSRLWMFTCLAWMVMVVYLTTFPNSTALQRTNKIWLNCGQLWLYIIQLKHIWHIASI